MEVVEEIHGGVALDIEGVADVLAGVEKVFLNVVSCLVRYAVQPEDGAVAVVIHLAVLVGHDVAGCIAYVERVDGAYLGEDIEYSAHRVGGGVVVGRRTSYLQPGEGLGIGLKACGVAFDIVSVGDSIVAEVPEAAVECISVASA